MLNARRLLVPVDFSESAAHARAIARRMAVRLSAEMHVLHVTRHDVLGSAFAVPEDSAARASAPEPAEAARRRHVYASEWMGLPAERGEAPREVRAIRQADTPAGGIVTYAHEHEVDLIVMGTHGRTGLRRLAMGSVAEAVMREARQPVLTVRRGLERVPEESPRRLVVPVDFSEASYSVVGHACALAAATGAAVDLLHVVQVPRPASRYRTGQFIASMPRIVRRAREDLRALAERAGGVEAGMRFCVLVGEPAPSIVSFAEVQHADGIVMGTRGRTGFQRLTLGSIAEQVVRRAPCTVLTLKAHGCSLVAVSDPAETEMGKRLPDTNARSAEMPPAAE